MFWGGWRRVDLCQIERSPKRREPLLGHVQIRQQQNMVSKSWHHLRLVGRASWAQATVRLRQRLCALAGAQVDVPCRAYPSFLLSAGCHLCDSAAVSHALRFVLHAIFFELLEVRMHV